MTVNQLIEQKNMTKYRLSKESHIHHSTINDICAGRAELILIGGPRYSSITVSET